MKGRPLIQIARPPLKPTGLRTWLTMSMKLVQKQQEETIRKNLEAFLLQKGSFMLQVQQSHPDRQNSITEQTHSCWKGLKLKTNWQMILFMMKTIYPVEFCLAVNFLVAIRGSNSAKATTEEMNTNRDENRRVTAAWNKCQPCQQTISGKLIITWYPSFQSFWHCTTESKVYVIGKNRMVTKRGTSCARITRGQVNLNFFLEKEQLTQMMSRSTRIIRRISEQSKMRKVLKLTPGRYVLMLKRENTWNTFSRVSPPFHTAMIVASKGKASICRQSAPDSNASPQMVSSSSSSSLSSMTNRTLKMESLRSLQVLRMQFCSSNPIQLFVSSAYFIEFRRTVSLIIMNLNLILKTSYSACSCCLKEIEIINFFKFYSLTSYQLIEELSFFYLNLHRCYHSALLEKYSKIQDKQIYRSNTILIPLFMFRSMKPGQASFQNCQLFYQRFSGFFFKIQSLFC